MSHSETIQRVADVFDTTAKDIVQSGRFKHIARARHAAAYIFRNRDGLSYTALGRTLGNRYHSTMMHSVAEASRLMRDDRAFCQKVAEILKLEITS
jgi:chromosomal replication initiation ATPase DnaA